MPVEWDVGRQISCCYPAGGGRGGGKKFRSCSGQCALGISCPGFHQRLGEWGVVSARR